MWMRTAIPDSAVIQTDIQIIVIVTKTTYTDTATVTPNLTVFIVKEIILVTEINCIESLLPQIVVYIVPNVNSQSYENEGIYSIVI